MTSPQNFEGQPGGFFHWHFEKKRTAPASVVEGGEAARSRPLGSYAMPRQGEMRPRCLV